MKRFVLFVLMAVVGFVFTQEVVAGQIKDPWSDWRLTNSDDDDGNLHWMRAKIRVITAAVNAPIQIRASVNTRDGEGPQMVLDERVVSAITDTVYKGRVEARNGANIVLRAFTGAWVGDGISWNPEPFSWQRTKIRNRPGRARTKSVKIVFAPILPGPGGNPGGGGTGMIQPFNGDATEMAYVFYTPVGSNASAPGSFAGFPNSEGESFTVQAGVAYDLVAEFGHWSGSTWTATGFDRRYTASGSLGPVTVGVSQQRDVTFNKRGGDGFN